MYCQQLYFCSCNLLWIFPLLNDTLPPTLHPQGAELLYGAIKNCYIFIT